MTQGSKLFDELGKLMNNAAGVADGVRREIETAVKSQLERMINDMDLVKREDFDALRELTMAQSAEIKALTAEVEALKGDTAGKSTGKSTGKTTAAGQ
jgi:BMFP domain-containing protein YqiC